MSNKIGLVLIAVGFLGFLGGIITAAACGLPAATKIAVGGTAGLFVGGVLRVYTE